MTENNKIAFVVIPGFAPDNYPVIHLRDQLLSLGYHAVAVPFWGDSKINNLSNLTIKECEEGVSSVISSLLKEYQFVIGIGISLGAALLIEYAKTHNDLSHIVSIGTPFKLKNRIIIKLLFHLYPVINLLWQIGAMIGIKRMLPVDAGKMIIAYLESDFLLDLQKVKTPILFLHSEHDMITNVKVLPFFMNKIMSKDKEIIYFNKIGHTIGYDEDLDEEIIKSVVKYCSKDL